MEIKNYLQSDLEISFKKYQFRFQMSPQIQYQIHLIFRKFNSLTLQWKILKILLVLCQTLFLMLFLINHMKNKLVSQFPSCQKQFDFVDSYLLSPETSNIAYYIGLGLNIMLVITILLKSKKIYKNLNIQLGKKIEGFLLYLSITVLYLIQIVAYLQFWDIFNVYKQKGLILSLIKGLLPVLIYTLNSYKYQKPSLCNSLTFPTILLNMFSFHELWILLQIFLSVYLVVKKSCLVSKCCLLYSILVMIFVVLHNTSFYQEYVGEIGLSFIFLCVWFIVVSALVIKWVQNNLFSQIQIQECYYQLSRLKTILPYEQLSFSQFYKLFNKLNSFSDRNQTDKSQGKFQQLSHYPKKLTLQDFFLCLKNHLNRQAHSANINRKESIPISILALKVQLTLGEKMNQLLINYFLLQNEVKNGQLIEMSTFWQLKQQIQEKFLRKKGQQNFADYVTRVNLTKEAFFKGFVDVLDQTQNFWDELSETEVQQSAIQSRISKIIRVQNSINEKLKILQKQSSGANQNFFFQTSLLGSILNNYKQQQSLLIRNDKSNKLIVLNQESSQNLDYFIIIQKDRIKYMSKSFSKSLKTIKDIQNEGITQVLGEYFNIIIEHKIKNITAEGQQQEFIVPIIRQNQTVDVRLSNLVWYPSLEACQRFVITFSDSLFSHNSYILIDSRTQRLCYFNKKFIELFHIDSKVLQNQRKKGLLFYELFSHLQIGETTIINEMIQGKSIKCQINLKSLGFNENGYSLKSKSKIDDHSYSISENSDQEQEQHIFQDKKIKFQEKHNVTITILQTIQIFQDQKYYILRVNPESRQFEPSTSSSNNNISSHKTSNPLPNPISSSLKSKGLILLKQYEKQKFFCKIPNNYQNKIIEKQSQLSEPQRWRHRYALHLMFSIIAIGLLITAISTYELTSTRVKKYKDYGASMQNKSQQYALLMQTYSAAIKKYYVKSYPEQITLVKKMTPASLIAQYTTTQQRFLDDFLNRYLLQMNKRYTETLPYKIYFDQFTIETDTSKTTLMDWAQHVKQNILTNEIKFLLNNYDNYRQLTLKSQDSFAYGSYIDEISQQTYIYSVSTVIGANIVIIGMLLVLNKVNDAIDAVFNLLSLLNEKQIHECKQTFFQKKLQLLDKIESNAQLGNFYQISVDHKNKKAPQNPLNLSQHPFLSHNTSRSSLIFLESNKQTPIDSNSIKKKIIGETFISKNKRKLFYFFILVFLNVAFILDELNLQLQKKEVNQILDSKKGLYKTLIYMKRGQIDAIIQPVKRHFLGKNIELPVNWFEVDLMFEIQEHMISKRMKKFSADAKKILNGNLCELKSTFPAKIIGCEYYLNGMLTRGFNQAFDVYKDNARKVSNLSLSQFGAKPCSKTKCPPFFQHEYSSIMLGQNVRYILSLFNLQVLTFYDDILKQTSQEILLKILIILIVVVWYLIETKKLKERCNIALKGFVLVPRQVMSSMRIASHIRKNKILEKFDML